MCIKKVACGLQKVVKEDGREVLEPVFVEVDCPEDMHRITSKIESCKTVTPKIEHDGIHGGHGGVTVSPTDNNDALTNNIVSPTDNYDSPITGNDSPIGKNDSPIGKNDSPIGKNDGSSTGNGSPREVVCIETGEVFANATQAGKAIGTARQNITACCNGKRKKAGGFQWKYL